MREAQPLVQVGPRGSPQAAGLCPTAQRSTLLSSLLLKENKQTRRMDSLVWTPNPWIRLLPLLFQPAQDPCQPPLPATGLLWAPISPPSHLSHPRFAQTPSLPRCLHPRDPRQGVRALPRSSIKALLGQLPPAEAPRHAASGRAAALLRDTDVLLE